MKKIVKPVSNKSFEDSKKDKISDKRSNLKEGSKKEESMDMLGYKCGGSVKKSSSKPAFSTGGRVKTSGKSKTLSFLGVKCK